MGIIEEEESLDFSSSVKSLFQHRMSGVDQPLSLASSYNDSQQRPKGRSKVHAQNNSASPQPELNDLQMFGESLARRAQGKGRNP